jgi:hypothetical protein
VSFDFAIELLAKCFIDFGGHHENLAMLSNALILFPVLKVFEFFNSSGHWVHLLSCMLIVMMVKKTILMRICRFNTLFGAHQLEDVILFFF